MVPIDPTEVTPEHVYLSRRRFMKGLGALTFSQLVLAACRSSGDALPRAPATAGSSSSGGDQTSAGSNVPNDATTGELTDELGDPLTEFESVTTYNNFYEYSTHKDDPAKMAQGLRTSPWPVQVGGLVGKPRTFDVPELTRLFEPEERIYRLRCVEGWSMVIPWLGFPLHRLLAEVNPLPEAKYVRFETLLDPDQMPGQRGRVLDWPYVEGLRMDEAENDLALIATGLYGKDLLPQNGAPLRLVVPWKYGFKSVKSVVKIDLVAEQPANTWAVTTPNEYGFYANVNPEVDHPRWSQASERRIGEFGRRRTLMFNGYEDEVAHLYAGMDLSENF